jgi:hypothetical protein
MNYFSPQTGYISVNIECMYNYALGLIWMYKYLHQHMCVKVGLGEYVFAPYFNIGRLSWIFF